MRDGLLTHSDQVANLLHVFDLRHPQPALRAHVIMLFRWSEYPRFSVGYRHMIEFFTRCLWDVASKSRMSATAHSSPAIGHRIQMVSSASGELNYKYLMRMDEESLLHSRIGYNLFDFMESKGYVYAFRQISWESGFSGENFHSFLRSFLLRNELLQPQWLLNQCVPGTNVSTYSKRRCGDIYGAYNNFFISRIDFWKQPKIQHFLAHVKHSGKIYTKRWNDILWHSAAVQESASCEPVVIVMR